MDQMQLPNDDPDVVLYITDTGTQLCLDFKAHSRVEPVDPLAELLQRPGIRVTCVTEFLDAAAVISS